MVRRDGEPVGERERRGRKRTRAADVVVAVVVVGPEIVDQIGLECGIGDGRQIMLLMLPLFSRCLCMTYAPFSPSLSFPLTL